MNIKNNAVSILLISLLRSLYDDNICEKNNNYTPPFGLILLTSILIKSDINCDILYCEAEQITLDKIMDYIIYKDYKYTGITSVAPSINNEVIKNIMQKIFILFFLL